VCIQYNITIGGVCDSNHTVNKHTYVYSFSCKQWNKLQLHGGLLAGRYGHSMGIINKFLYIFGGKLQGGGELCKRYHRIELFNNYDELRREYDAVWEDVPVMYVDVAEKTLNDTGVPMMVSVRDEHLYVFGANAKFVRLWTAKNAINKVISKGICNVCYYHHVICLCHLCMCVCVCVCVCMCVCVCV